MKTPSLFQKYLLKLANENSAKYQVWFMYDIDHVLI